MTSAHRYMGLATALFLIIAGLTGSAVAFRGELDRWLNPELYGTSSDGPLLSPSALSAAIEKADPRVRVTHLTPSRSPRESAIAFVEPRSHLAHGESDPPGYNEAFVDPVTGEILGVRQWDTLRFDRAHVLPFLYGIHVRLFMPGSWGFRLLGIVALLWMLNCIVGLYLTLPQRQPRFAKWKRFWKIQLDASAARINLDLHRAGGLWLWAAFMVMASSAVALSLREEIFNPLVSMFSPLTPSPVEQRPRTLPSRADAPALSFDLVFAAAASEGRKRGWQDPSAASYDSSQGLYAVSFRPSPFDRGTGFGAPVLYFHDRTGLIGARVPGTGTAGDIFSDVQLPLHTGQIAGLTGRVIVALVGLGVALLSITGIVIWLIKRPSRVR